MSSTMLMADQAVIDRDIMTLKSVNNLTEFEQANKILNIIFSRRCLLPNESEASEDWGSESFPHIGKIIAAIRLNKKINLILPGFPAKSPNRRKTLGPLPDLADKHGLHNLHLLCEEIQQVYSPGAKVTICSDGRVFADLVRIPDIDVTNYGTSLRQFAEREYASTFEFFNLDHVYPEVADFDILREELLIGFGESIYKLRQRCKDEKSAKAMYLGITRFIVEDYSGIEPFINESRTAIQKISRLISYRIIQRSNAWTRLLEKYFSDAIRLSVHPQYRVSEKIGIKLVETDDCWLTPWHSVAVRHQGKITLHKREVAERIGLLAFENGVPSHFERLE